MPGDKRTTITQLRVVTIRARAVKVTSYRIEVKLVAPLGGDLRYIHRTRRS